jgi:hypothetical protein
METVTRLLIEFLTWPLMYGLPNEENLSNFAYDISTIVGSLFIQVVWIIVLVFTYEKINKWWSKRGN